MKASDLAMHIVTIRVNRMGGVAGATGAPEPSRIPEGQCMRWHASPGMGLQLIETEGLGLVSDLNVGGGSDCSSSITSSGRARIQHVPTLV